MRGIAIACLAAHIEVGFMLENLGERLPHETIVVNNQDAAASGWCPGLSVVGRSRQRAAQEGPLPCTTGLGIANPLRLQVALFKSARHGAKLAGTVPTVWR